MEPKRKPGRKATKRNTVITDGPLRWPSGARPTDPQDRVRGSFRLNSRQRAEVVVERQKKTMANFFKRINVESAEITFGFTTPQEAVDENYEHPGVAIYYNWRDQKTLKLACDSYTTSIANFRACMETLDGFAKGIKHRQVFSDFSIAFRHFGLFKVEKKVTKAASKAHLDAHKDWQEILEIPDEEIDLATGLPKNPRLSGSQRLRLVALYHPDKPTSPDAESFHRIEEAAEWVAARFKEASPEAKAEAKAKRQADADARRSDREAEQDAKNPDVDDSEENFDRHEDVGDDDVSDDDDDSYPEISEAEDDEDDDSTGHDDDSDEEYRQEQPSDDDLFDTGDDDGDDEDEDEQDVKFRAQQEQWRASQSRAHKDDED